MNEFFLQFLPTLLLLDRVCMAVLGILLLLRCARSLFFPKGEPEIWGFLSMSNGARYQLQHWENMIGRSRSADIRINFPSVSRSHAAVCRDETGKWQVYPLNAKSGVLHNGQRVFTPSPLRPGDSIAVGGVELYFFPANQTDEVLQAQKRTRAGRKVSAPVTLMLLTLFQTLMLIQFLPGLTDESALPILTCFGGLALFSWLLYVGYRLLHRTAYELETLVFFLITMGFAITAAYSPSALFKQLITVGLGACLFFVLNLLLRNMKAALRLRWPVAAAAAALLAFNLLLGQQIFGAKNWIVLGPISFQPSELVKIAFILAGTATLDRLFAKRNLIFTLLFSAYCVGCLALMSDFGTALIFFVAFLCIAFLRTGDLASVVMAVAAAGLGGGIVLHFKPYIADRFTVWLHAWEYTQSTGYQQSRTMSAIASGGLFGVGPEDAWLKHIGAANTDLVFGVIGEEFGLLLALCAVAALVIIAVFTIRATAYSRSSFYTIAACATTAMLVFQTALNVLGSVDLLPLTGVTFPFVSMGGSSMISCWGLLAFLKAADTRQNASFIFRLPKGKVPRVPKAPEPEPTFFDQIPDIPVDDIFGKGGGLQ